MSNDRNDEPFLSRWSRQKQEGVKKAKEDKRQAGASDKDAPIAKVEPETQVDLSKLPKLEDLTAESDISGFLQKGVPDALQKLALRRMWSLDPAIRDFVEIAENQWDFNAPGGVPGLFQELAEGSDVGVWLTQATPSVVSEQQKERVAPEEEVAAEMTEADDGGALATTASGSVELGSVESGGAESGSVELVALQHDQPTVPTVSMATAAALQSVPVVAEQQPDVAQKSTTLTDGGLTDNRPSRRRHGGALPFSPA
jgi:Protein of unknown function (DUF3306)